MCVVSSKGKSVEGRWTRRPFFFFWGECVESRRTKKTRSTDPACLSLALSHGRSAPHTPHATTTIHTITMTPPPPSSSTLTLPRPPSATVVDATCWACSADVRLPSPPPATWTCTWCGAVTEEGGGRRRTAAALLRWTPVVAAVAVHTATIAGVFYVLPALFPQGGTLLFTADALAAIAVANTSLHAWLAATTRLPRPAPPREYAPGAVPYLAYEGVKQCLPCGGVHRPPSHRHCGACRECVPRSAHHCAFVGVCIPSSGGPRARHFVLAVAWLAVAAALAVEVCVAALVVRRREVLRVVARASAGAPPPPRFWPYTRRPPPPPSVAATLAALPTVLMHGPPFISTCVCLLGTASAALAGVAAAAADCGRPAGGWHAGASRLFGGGSVVSSLLPPWGVDKDE